MRIFVSQIGEKAKETLKRYKKTEALHKDSAGDIMVLFQLDSSKKE